ncbi:MAG: transposase [Acidobacteriota bacterium]
MARTARIVVPGYPFHIVHRGNHRKPVFYSDADRQVYLRLLLTEARRYGLEIWAYCLMLNHIHLLGVPLDAEALADAIGNTHRAYARYIHESRGWTGHLWANRFRSSLLDEQYLWDAVRYVENNPVRAKLVERAELYPWSSAAAHSFGKHDALLSNARPFPGHVPDWSAWLAEPIPTELIDTIRRNTRTGRPTIDDALTAELERVVGRRLRPQRPGRKPKSEIGMTSPNFRAR